jgi:S-DNA-T family DNA segregation ATPase FtsK/SpoIIIE
MKKEHINEIQAIVILALGIILLISLRTFVPEDLPWYASQPNTPVYNRISIVGAYVAGSLFFVFGYSAYVFVVFLLFWSWSKFSSREFEFSWVKFLSGFLLVCVLSALCSMIGIPDSTDRFVRSGVAGLVISEFFIKYFGQTGSYMILVTLTVLNIILIGEFLVSPIFLRFSSVIQSLIQAIMGRFESRQERVSSSRIKAKNFKERFEDRAKTLLKRPAVERDIPAVVPKETYSPLSREIKPEKPKIRIAEEPKPESVNALKTQPSIIGDYQMPALDLLDDPPAVSSSKVESELVEGAKMLEETLADFSVAVRVADIERGPVITRYELEPAPGVKVQRITALSDDIALAMRAPSVRIVAPIPGKNRVGIEVPNGASASVFLKDVLQRSSFKSEESKLMLALGKDIAGVPMIADLAEMPHLLIAGTTGSGKTVCVNGIIMSMLFHASPDDVKFLMVDPKMVELAQYNDLPHCLCPTVTDPKKVSSALNWVVGEMESRYSTLSKASVRNIQAYRKLGHNMSYIVVIIDELADLMQVAAKTIESAITRLAQLSRAVGIHLILATQRPSVDVITGVIKANFPARISFKVASKVDSRTVLDMNGAENLVGRGDMLFMRPGDAKPTRGQCSFVSDSEIQRVIDFIKTQQNPIYDDSILQHQKSAAAGGADQKDELYGEAVKLVIETNQASVSILQRRMRLGYTRAARLIDMMEQDGIVGPYCGSKPRDILVDREEWLIQNMEKEKGEES